MSAATDIVPSSDQTFDDTQDVLVAAGESFDPTTAKAFPTPKLDTPSSGVSPSGQDVDDTHEGFAAGESFDPTTAKEFPTPKLDTPSSGVSQPPFAHNTFENQACLGDGWLELRLWAAMWDDAQRARIAACNRAERGGVDPDIYAGYVATLRAAEHECLLAMRRCYRRVVPAEIQAWQRASAGLGIDRLAKILGHLGHPVWATPHHWEGSGAARLLVSDPPFARSVSQLWQYCGVGAPSRRSKGMSADEVFALGNPALKKLLYLAALECMKCRGGVYRLIYERARLEVADKVHSVECVRCGPSGKPALPGSPWSPGHQMAHALRIVGKEILRDLWIVAGGEELTNNRRNP
jgi:hypothetical protein